MFKNNIKKVVVSLIPRISNIIIGKFLRYELVKSFINKKAIVNYHDNEFVFAVPSSICQYRADTFAIKEPDTLAWIDSMTACSIFWDIGANVGSYSIYAAKVKNCDVYAFEPSVFNLEILARNIFFNKLQSKIKIIPVAVSDRLGFDKFQLTTTSWGGALSSFSSNIDHNGKPLQDVFEYQTLGVSIEEAVHLLKIPKPNHIKIDVDGIEHLILRGGKNILKTAESVLVEINDDFKEQSDESIACLNDAGFVLYKKCYLGDSNLYNQWWIKN
jgi:FkbM family methyltransferase